MDIDDLIGEEGVRLVVDAFLHLVNSPRRRGENRAEVIENMAYMAFTGNLPEWGAENLKEELFEFLSLDRYEKYKEMDVVPDLPSYKSLLEPMLTFVVEVNPQWISDVINKFNLEGGRYSERYVYTAEELSKLLSDHQKSKGAQ